MSLGKYYHPDCHTFFLEGDTDVFVRVAENFAETLYMFNGPLVKDRKLL